MEGTLLSIVENCLLELREEHGFDRVTIPLSSGIDSNFTLLMVNHFLPEIKVNCISLGFGNANDEIDQAQENARLLNSNFEAIIKYDFLSDLPRLIEITKEPRWNLYTYYCFEAGKKHSKFFFTGDGGDELFGGYTFRYAKFLSLLKSNSTWKERLKIYLSCHGRDWVPNQTGLFGPKIKFSWDSIYRLLRPSFDNALEPLNQVFLADYNGKLTYEWIPLNSLYEKHFAIDIRSFFLTPRMIKLATHIPWQQKYNNKTQTGKIPIYSLLKKATQYKDLSPSKKGFSADLSFIWEHNGQEIIDCYLNSKSQIVTDGLISKSWISNMKVRLANNHLKERERYISKLFSLLALEIWYRIFITGSLKGNQKL